MAKRRIKMRRTKLGADPVLVQEYTEGETYLVGRELADAFVTAGDADRIKKAQEAPTEPKPSENTEEEPSETAGDSADEESSE